MIRNIESTIHPLKKIMKGLPGDNLVADGLLYQDVESLTPCQQQCTSRLGASIQLEQEAYMIRHPEVKALCELYIKKLVQKNSKRINPLADAGAFFTRPVKELDKDVRNRLGLPSEGPYVQPQRPFNYRDFDLEYDLRNIVKKNYPPEPWIVPAPTVTTPDTVSSDFISIITSDSTLPTPEPVPTPEPTLSQILFNVVSKTVDKAVYSRVNDEALRYDTAYVELMKAVEEAMEIPVVEIKEDIAALFYNSYKMFELDIMEKERIAAEIAWQKRMRKKLKKTLRRQNNFKGHETPPTPSEISSHESWKVPPQKPCVCHPQFRYNRYAKDRFGIYLPRDVEFYDGNITVTPAVSMENLEEGTTTSKSDVATKNAASRNTTS